MIKKSLIEYRKKLNKIVNEGDSYKDTPLIIAVDFDDTIAIGSFPSDKGLPNKDIIDFLRQTKEELKNNVYIIIWTCRTGDKNIDYVKNFCVDNSVPFDAINENCPIGITFFGTNPRKIYADIYIDDKAVSTADMIKKVHRSPVKVKDKQELKEIIKDEMEFLGDNCDLNHIDVSNVTDMSYVFHNSQFNGDISKWNVSNVKDMCRMFAFSSFNGDISKWNVSKVESMRFMFYYSFFNQNISDWNVSNLENMNYMFAESKFNGDISKWNISNVNYMNNVFYSSPLVDNPPTWYKIKGD